jgi:hypothetical protein
MGFWEVVKSIPSLVGLLGELMRFLKATFGDNPQKFLRDSAKVFEELRTAKTLKEKQEAASKIQGLIERL